MSRTLRPPEAAGEAGRRLWSSVLREYALTGADLELLRQAVLHADELATLEALVRATGPLIRDGAGQPKVNPALVQHRLLTDTLGKTLAALRVVGEALEPGDEHDPYRPQRRNGYRGTYQLRAVGE